MPVLLFLLATVFPLAGLFCATVQFCVKRSNTVSCALTIGLSIASMCLGVEHASGAGDLVSYARIATMLSAHSMTDIMIYAPTSLSSYPLGIVWLWVVGRIGNTDLLQWLNAFVEYSIIFYILFDYSKRRKCGNLAIVIGSVLLLISVSPYSCISSVRSTHALAIGLLALYLDFVKGMKNPAIILLYIAPCLIHSAGFVIIAFRLLLILAKNYPRLATVLMIASIPLVYYISIAASGWLPSGVSTAAQKLIAYADWTSGGWATIVSDSLVYQLLKYVNVAFASLLLVIVGFARRSSLKRECLSDDDRNLGSIAVPGLGLIIVVALVITVPSYLRFTYVFYPVAITQIVGYISDRGDVTNMLTRNEGQQPTLLLLAFAITSILMLTVHMRFVITGVIWDRLIPFILFGVLAYML